MILKIDFRKYLLIAAMLLIAVFAATLFSSNAYADIASDTCGTCSWVIDDGGILTISPTDGVSGTLSNSFDWCSYPDDVYEVYVEPGVSTGTSCSGMFYELHYCGSIDISELDTSAATDMSYMFSYCQELTHLTLGNKFDTSNVTNMHAMFRSCCPYNLTGELTSCPDWTMENVRYADYMFESSSADDVSFLEDAEQLISAGHMFDSCSIDFNEVVIPSTHLTSTAYMFYHANGPDGYSSGNATLDCSGINATSLTDMSYMFSEFSGSDTVIPPAYPPSNVNVSHMFEGASIDFLDLSDWEGWTSSNLANISGILSGCKASTISFPSSLDIIATEFPESGKNDLGWVKENGSGTVYTAAEMKTQYNLNSGENPWAGTWTRYTWWHMEDNDTVLVIGTGVNDEITIPEYSYSGSNTGSNWGFDSYRRTTTTVRVEGIVHTPSSAGGMFDNFSYCTTFNLSGLDTSASTDMSYMFYNCSAAENIDVSGLNTANVTKMNNMFDSCRALETLNLSNFNTANVTDMRYMFRNCSALETLNISNFDTGKVTRMDQMFANDSVLKSVNLSPDFSFTGKNISGSNYKAILPTPSSTTPYTGKWVKEDGTANALTPTQLRDQYAANAALWNGVWVWEETPTKYTLVFTADNEVSGSMANQKIVAAEAGTINPCQFRKFNYHLDHWVVVGSDPEVTYADGATIPANTYAIGDTVTLRAVMVPNDNSASMTNGEFDLYLHPGEMATFDNIPAGTAYQVWEETPDGWVLVSSTGTSGEIQPLETSAAEFSNEYVPGTTTVTFHGSKIFNNAAAVSNGFQFILESGGTPIETVRNTDGGLISFSTITYDTTGTYVYTIREDTSYVGSGVGYSANDIQWDTHTETITVVVTEPQPHVLSADVTYDSDGIAFNNPLKPSILRVIKVTVGQTEANEDQEFSVKITLTNPDGTLSGGTNYYWYTENADPNLLVAP